MFDLEKLKLIPIERVAADLGFQLTAKGRGRCCIPGHEDRNPSFSIRRTTNTFRCFACGASGSAIDLTRFMLDLDFKDACAWLQSKYTNLPISNRSQHDTFRPRQKTFATQVQKTVPDSKYSPDPEIYDWLLKNFPLLPSGSQYLADRGFSMSTLQHFQVGQIEDSRTLLSRATYTFGTDRLRKCGIAKTGSTSKYLIFPSGHLIFPFFDDKHITYIQSRRADNHPEKRWICPAEIPQSTFNLNVFQQNPSTIIICEGITDVMSAHQLKLHALGILGANAQISESVINRLKNHNVAIISDNDTAGKRMSTRLVHQLSSRGISVISKTLPDECNDLNDLLRSRQQKQS